MLQVIQGAYSRFEYGIKSEETRRKYTRRLELFFDFNKIEGNTIQEKSDNFLAITIQENIQKVTDLVLNYMTFHIRRAQKNEISRSTVRNFYKPIKLFCEMNNIILSWKVISKGIPAGPENANDRIPTMEEILEVLKYPDRRIKPVLYTMISSGIRIGAWEWLNGIMLCQSMTIRKTLLLPK